MHNMNNAVHVVYNDLILISGDQAAIITGLTIQLWLRSFKDEGKTI